MPLQAKFKNKNIRDILHINKILFELETKKDTLGIKNIKKIYYLDLKHIQIALKIDKTNDQINNLDKFNKSKKESKKKITDEEDTEYSTNEIF